MKTDTILQEILLLPTRQLSQTWCEIDPQQKAADLSKTEALEKACWNGMLEDLLPGIIDRSSSGRKLGLWQIRQGETYLQIELCEYPVHVEKQFSIDPCIFLHFRRCN